jgi:hypothetical protein
MGNVRIQDSTLTSIGEAIRNKSGKSDLILPSNMATEISKLQTSAGEVVTYSLLLNTINNTSTYQMNWENYIDDSYDGFCKIISVMVQHTNSATNQSITMGKTLVQGTSSDIYKYAITTNTSSSYSNKRYLLFQENGIVMLSSSLTEESPMEYSSTYTRPQERVILSILT